MLVWNTCPKYTQLRTSVNDLPEVRKIHEDNKQLFDELSNFTGMPITTVDDVSSLYSTLTAEVNFIPILVLILINIYRSVLYS